MTESNALKQRAALASIFASAVLALGKLVAGLLTGSLALLSEAGHGLIDTGATILTYFAVREAGKPADAEHHFGHAKIESVAALAETGLLLALAAFVLAEAIQHLFAPGAAVLATPLAFAVLAVSIIVDAVRWRSLAAIAKATRSDALAADALHFSSDLVSSVFVMIGLGATRLGYPQGDALAALAVALFIGIAGLRLARRTVDSLVDAAPHGLSEKVRAIVAGVPGVAAVKSIRLRPAGGTVMGEVIVGVGRSMALERVAQIKDRVSIALVREIPEAELTITANPMALDNESMLERVLLVAARRRVAVHHVTVQDIDGIKSVSLDMEVDGSMAHGKAHELASALENAIRAEIGDDIEVETHMEPLEMRELAGRNASPSIVASIADSLVQRAAEQGTVFDIHNVRVRETPAGLMVNYHCRIDPAISVNQVHARVDALDRRVRANHFSIARIVGHADPLGG